TLSTHSARVLLHKRRFNPSHFFYKSWRRSRFIRLRARIGAWQDAVVGAADEVRDNRIESTGRAVVSEREHTDRPVRACRGRPAGWAPPSGLVSDSNGNAGQRPVPRVLPGRESGQGH